jgi:hypothetical protein
VNDWSEDNESNSHVLKLLFFSSHLASILQKSPAMSEEKSSIDWSLPELCSGADRERSDYLEPRCRHWQLAERRLSGVFLGVLISFISAAILTAADRETEASSGMDRKQVLNLKAGWNSVFLEVEPAEIDPDKLFAGTPIDRVAHHFRRVTSAEFIQDPGDEDWSKAGWAAWFAPSREDAVLTNLHAIHGNLAYLVHSQRDFSWEVEGSAQMTLTDWRANSYHLTGFPVSATSPPTFEQYFDGSGAHEDRIIYRLDRGRWIRIANPAAELISRGQAYWVFCRGGSDHQGPVSLKLPTREGLLLRGGAGVLELQVENRSSDPVQVTFTGFDAGVPVRLHFTAVTASEIAAASVPIADRLVLPVLEAGGRLGVQLDLDETGLGEGLTSGLLSMETDTGIHQWIPLAAIK